MRLLNLCCGATRPGEPWTNLDNLHAVLLPGTPERTNLDAEPNYVNHDVLSGPLPFDDNIFDGILASHCVEHWDCQESVRVLKECRRVLGREGMLIVSVPNASYFREVYRIDTPDNSEYLFGEKIYEPDGERTFFGYGLFNRFHKQVLTEDSLWCILVRAGFHIPKTFGVSTINTSPLHSALVEQLNRRKFSLEMIGI